ncbi:hypothetical protein LTR09_004363 [Extremus antarcticus]|uniref:Cupin type-1 domain-containing protein n=1 Tax=Extremus antarcticus TaxID=702011 RepID=A0AAJ0DIA4_9PEZI|nr:hypothetical protein LTR09_004363 [Extremus antarcticus]
MVQVKTYHLRPTPLIPNSPYPLLHYPGLLLSRTSPSATPTIPPAQVHNLYARNGWKTQWIFRYGHTQTSHYHSRAHECMCVLTGSARIRFGVADTSEDLEASTHGAAFEGGGVEVEAKAGDVFVIPAGVAHKTFDTLPEAEFVLLTPGGAHRIGGEGEDARKVLDGVVLDGFTMMGAYPDGGGEWDFAVGGEDRGEFERVWAVPKPGKDPILGTSGEGLVGIWKEEGGRRPKREIEYLQDERQTLLVGQNSTSFPIRRNSSIAEILAIIGDL